MKSSLISKIVVLLCILCLGVGFFSIDKNKPYEDSTNSSSKKSIVPVSSNKIAVMELEGTIVSSYESGFFAKETTAGSVLKQLSMLQKNDKIKGLILKINSPGGTVGMSQNIYNQLMKLREKIPVVVSFDDIAASGGYYIASAADRIVSQEGTITGSIGVIFSFIDYHNLLTEKLSVDNVVIKSGKYKDIASGARKMTDDEKVLMQELVDDSYSQFLSAITNGRVNRNDNYSVAKTELKDEILKHYADGRVFTGRQAKMLGFVDVLGDMDTAKTMIEKMAQEKFNNKLPAELVTTSSVKSTLNDYFLSFSEYNSKSGIKITDIIPKSMILSRRPLYLWE